MAAWPKRGDTQAGSMGTAYQTRPGPPPQSSSSLHVPGGVYLPTAATASSRRSSSSSSSRSSSAGNLQHNNRSAVHQANNSPGQDDDEDDDEDGDDDNENYEEVSGEDTAMAQNDPSAASSIRASTTASKRTTKKSTSASKPSSSTIAPTSTSTSSSRKRKRVSRACDACYIRKDKCDGASPSCSICARLSRSCTYTRPEKKRGPQQGVRGRLEAQCAGLEAVLGWILWCARCEVQVGGEGEGGRISRNGGASDVKSGTLLKLLLQPSMVATSAMWSPSFAFPPPSSSLMSLAQLWRTSVLATYLTSPLAPSSPGLAIGLEGAASVADGLDADLASRQAGGEVGILGSGDPHPPAGGENEERSDEDEVDGVENVSPDGSHRRRSSRGGGGVESSNHKPTKTPNRPPGRTRRTLDPAPAVRKPAPNPAAAHAPVSRGPPPPRPSRPDDGLPLGTSPEAMNVNGSEGLTQRQEQIIVEPGADVWARPIAAAAAHHTGQQTRAATDHRDSFVFPPPPSSSGTGWKAHGHSHSHESHQRPSDGTAQMGMGVSSGPGEWSRGAYGGNDQNRPGQMMHHNGGQSEANITLYPSGHASQMPSTVPDSSSSIHAASRNAWGVPGPAASAAPSTHQDYLFNTNNNNNNNNNLSSFYFDTRDSFSFTDPDAQALLYALGMSAATVNGGGGGSGNGGGGSHMEGMNVQGMGGSLYAAGPQMSGGGGSGSNQQGSGSGSGSLGGPSYHAAGKERVGHQLRQDRDSTEVGASGGTAGRWDGVVGGGGAGNAGSTAAVGRKSVVGTNNVSSLETAAHASILFQLGLQEDAFGNSELNFPFGDWLGGGSASGAAVGGSSSTDPQPNSTTTSAGQKTLIAPTPTSSNPVQATHQQYPRRSMPTSRSAQSVGAGAAPTTTTTFASGTGVGVAGRVRPSTGPSPPDVSDTLRQFQMQAAEFIRRDPFGSGSGAGGTGTGTGAGAGAR